MPEFKHVTYSWDDSHAAALDPVDRLVYRSNILGADQRITNTGGGNTSSKIIETDPLTGQKTEVLWVKGSGGDLRTAKRENFSSLYQDKLIGLQTVYANKPNNGLKTPAEDEMVGMYSHTTFNLNPRPSSIDTPLHSFISGKHVDHMHPNAIIAIAASKNCEALTKEIFEGEMEYVPWMRPGFELGLAMQEIEKKNPSTQAIMMGQHGFISWDDDPKKCYELTLRLIEKASEYIAQKYEANGGDAKAFGGQNIIRYLKRKGGPLLPRSSRSSAVKFLKISASSAPSKTIPKFSASSILPMLPALQNLEPHAQITSCAPKSSLFTLLGMRKKRTSQNSKKSSKKASKRIGKISRSTIIPASMTTRLLCAIQTLPWFSSLASA